MEIRTEQEARENIENFTKEYLKLLLHKKTIDQEIKDMKDNYKEEGVPVSVVCKVINKIKAAKKKTDSERHEEDIIADWLEANKDIDSSISTLMAK
jgi:uncharacterized protein (UPF0335 family)